MSDEAERRLTEIAARLEAQMARLDGEIAATRPGAPGGADNDGAHLDRPSLLRRLWPSRKESAWEVAAQRLAELDGFRTTLRRKERAERENADEWERRAMLCVKAADDDLARQAIERRRECLHNATELDMRATQVEAVLSELRRGIEELQRSRREPR